MDDTPPAEQEPAESRCTCTQKSINRRWIRVTNRTCPDHGAWSEKAREANDARQKQGEDR